MRLPTHRENLYDVTNASCVSTRFWSRVFRFYSTDSTSGRNYTFSQVLHLILYIDGHAFGLLAKFVAQISTSLSILVTQICMLYHNCYCIFHCYLPSTLYFLVFRIPDDGQSSKNQQFWVI
jgi:hypothetical protein